MNHPSETLTALIYGFTGTQAIFVAAKLGLADVLTVKPCSCEELAQEVGVNTRRLAQLMRLLLALKVVSQDENGNFSLTPVGDRLKSGTIDSLKETALAIGGVLYPAWNNLFYGLKTNNTAFDYSLKTTLYEHLETNLEAQESFDGWMKESTRDWILPSLEMYDFSGVKIFVDVGGGNGALTAAVLKANPNIRAILFDRPDTATGALEFLSKNEVVNRCKIVGGNFFDSVPAGGELYIVSRVLLNWQDKEAIAILKNCRRAMTESGRLLIIDFVLPAQNTSSFLSVIDVNLFALCGLFVRSENEFENLLISAGLKKSAIIWAKKEDSCSLIEAVPFFSE